MKPDNDTLPHQCVPVAFPEANLVLKKPAGYTGECGDLHTCRVGTSFLSCWNIGLWYRIKFLFGAKIWLQIVSESHPMVALLVARTLFKPVVEKRRGWRNWFGAALVLLCLLIGGPLH